MNGNSNGDLPMNVSGNGDLRIGHMPAGVVSYGGPPVEPYQPPDLTPHVPPIFPILPVTFNQEWAMSPCTRCNRHVRTGEPCAWCLRAELDALKAALGDNAKPVEEIERLRAGLRCALGMLRDIEKAFGVPNPKIAELEKVLGPK